MRRLYPRMAHGLVVLALPLALLALALRITTDHWLVHWEYGKAGFPPDPYGLTTQERINLAEVCVDYLITDAGIDLLADLELEGGPAFNQRELQHMVDVKVVLGRLLASGVVAGVLVLGGTASLAARRASRSRAPAALLRGSQLALGLLFAVGILMLVGWQLFFVGFHELFFESGTWSFAYSDTLIRLYPERFWMDVGAVVVGLMVTEILLIGAGAFLWNRALDRRADDPAR